MRATCLLDYLHVSIEAYIVKVYHAFNLISEEKAIKNANFSSMKAAHGNIKVSVVAFFGPNFIVVAQ